MVLVKSVHDHDSLYVGHLDSLPLSQTFLKNGKAKFKAAIRKYLNTHPSYYLHEFFIGKGDL